MRKFKKSLGYAFDGIRYVFKSQRNFRIQIFIGGIALLLAVFFRISAGEMIALSFAIAFVLFAELINTAIESVLDLTIKEYNQMVMIAKDVAAAAVTITVANSIIIGIIIFLPKIINVLK